MTSPARTFLTAPEVPPDLLRLRPGDAVRLLRDRSILRVGYRLRADDLLPEAAALLESEAGLRLWGALAAATGGTHPHTAADLEWLVARTLVRIRRFGGPERGILAEERPLPPPCGECLPGSEAGQPGEGQVCWSCAHGPGGPPPLRVRGTRRCVLGTRYPPSGSGDDYEDGGLLSARHAVLVLLEGEARPRLSGDLRREA